MENTNCERNAEIEFQAAGKLTTIRTFSNFFRFYSFGKPIPVYTSKTMPHSNHVVSDGSFSASGRELVLSPRHSRLVIRVVSRGVHGGGAGGLPTLTVRLVE